MLQTVQKIGPLLDLFSPQRPEWGVSEVAEALDVPRSSVHALLASLVDTGLLQCRQRGRYRIGWRALELSEILRGDKDIRRMAAEVLEGLVAKHGETVHLAVLERSRVLYLDKVAGRHPVHVAGARVGSTGDPHCTALGKVLLAHLDDLELRHLIERQPLRRYTVATITSPDKLRQQLHDVRAVGTAFDRGEAASEVHCVAAPVRDEMGCVVAAVSISVPESRFTRSAGELRASVVQTAGELGRRLSAPDPELTTRTRLQSVATAS